VTARRDELPIFLKLSQFECPCARESRRA
jgi:hypothetical protein